MLLAGSGFEQGGLNYAAIERETVSPVPWWKEPTKDQWYAWWAAWLGWTLDAFDFTVFLLIMKPIADEFGVPVSEVAWILALTLWLRLVGAVASGWLADRIGRKAPLDDLDLLVFDLQFHRWIFADLAVFCWCSAPCWASAWEPNGRPARRWRWSNGRSAPAAL